MKKVKAERKMTSYEKLFYCVSVTILCLISTTLVLFLTDIPVAFIGCFIAMFGSCYHLYKDYRETRSEELEAKAKAQAALSAN